MARVVTVAPEVMRVPEVMAAAAVMRVRFQRLRSVELAGQAVPVVWRAARVVTAAEVVWSSAMAAPVAPVVTRRWRGVRPVMAVMAAARGCCHCGVRVVTAVTVVPAARVWRATTDRPRASLGSPALMVVRAGRAVTGATVVGWWGPEVLVATAARAAPGVLAVTVWTGWMRRQQLKPEAVAVVAATAQPVGRVAVVVMLGLAVFCCWSIPTAPTAAVVPVVRVGRPVRLEMVAPARPVMRTVPMVDAGVTAVIRASAAAAVLGVRWVSAATAAWLALPVVAVLM